MYARTVSSVGRRLGLDVRAGEWRAAGAAAAALALAQCGYGVAASAADALFVTRVGVRQLGTAFAASSAVLVVTLLAVGLLADRMDRSRLLAWLTAGAAVGLCGVAALVALCPGPAAVLALIASKQFGAAADLAFFVLVADRFDARQARRLVPVFVLAGGVGLAVGSFLVGPIAGAWGAQGALVAAGLAFAAASAWARGQPRTVRPALVAAARTRVPRPPWSSGWQAVRGSGLARSLALVVATAGVFAPILYYLLAGEVAAELGGEVAVAGFLGRYRGAVQLVTLVAQLAVAPAVLSRAGVAAALVIAPVGAVVAALAVAVRAELAVVVLAQASARLLDTAIQTPAERLVHNLLPRHQRGRVAGFVDGVAKRGGAIVGGLSASALVVWPTALGVVTVGVAVLWLWASVRLRGRFGALAVAELASRPLAPRGDADEQLALSLIGDTGAPAVQPVVCDLRSEDPRRRELAAELLQRISTRGRLDAAHELTEAARTLPPGSRAPLLVRIAQPTPAAVPGLLAIARAGGGDGALAIRLLGRVADAKITQALRLIPVEPHVEVALQVALGCGDADALIDQALASDSAVVRAAGLCELAAQLRGWSSEQLARSVTRFAAALDRSAAVPTEARSVALHALASELERRPASAELVLARAAARACAERALADSEATIRRGAVRLLRATADAGTAKLLARALSDCEEGVRSAAAEGLRHLGGGAVAALLVAARFGRRSVRNNALEVLTDLRLRGPELDELVEQELSEVLQTAALLGPAAALCENSLLVRRLQERIDEVAMTLLLTLEARLGAAPVADAARRLVSARDDGARARALEALDAALPRNYAALLVEVLEPVAPAVRAERARRHLNGGDGAMEHAVDSLLESSDPLVRMLAVHALGTAGRASHRAEIRAAARAAARTMDPIALMRRLAAGHDTEEEMPRSVERMLILSRIPLFVELSTRQLAALAEVIQWEIAVANQVVVGEGVAPEAMYFVVTGSVTVTDGGHQRRVGPGESLTELALFGSSPVGIVVTSTERTQLGRLDRVDFEELVDDLPGVALGVCRVLGRRLGALAPRA